MNYIIKSLVSDQIQGTIELVAHTPVAISYALFYKNPRYVVGLSRQDVMFKMYDDGKVVDVVLAENPNVGVVRLERESDGD
jgi:hypothetical protein